MIPPLQRYAAGGKLVKKLAKRRASDLSPLDQAMAEGVALRMQALLNKGAELENLPSSGLNLPAAYAGDQRSRQALQRRLSEQETGLQSPGQRKLLKLQN